MTDPFSFSLLNQFITPEWLLIVLLIAFLAVTIGLVIQQKEKSKVQQTLKQTLAHSKELHDQLESKNKELERFVRRVSHDLVAPIKSVQALVDITKMEDDPAEKDKCLDMIELSIDKQEEFIKRLLEQAKNYKPVKIESINLKSFINQCWSEISYWNPENKVQLDNTVQEGFELNGDKDRMKIILSNLLSNAIKYQRPDNDNQEVNVRVEKSEDYYTVSVIDNGEGVPEEAREKIFGMFERHSGTSSGSGLGLHIVREMLKKLDGEIQLKSEVGKGSTFAVTIPNHSQS